MRYFVNGCVRYAKKMKKNHYQLKSCLFFCIVLFFCESSQCEMKITIPIQNSKIFLINKAGSFLFRLYLLKNYMI